MKVVILAGGLPSTLIEEYEKVPKPMAEIGGKPILWHIMKYFASYGFNDFIVCGGYKIEMIKEYFMNFYYHQSDITVDLASNEIVFHRKECEDWKVAVVDTGLHTNMSERILQVQRLLSGEDFWLAYGDCVSDIALNQMLALHHQEHKTATLAVARPSGRNRILPITKLDGFRAGTDIGGVGEDAWTNACCMILTTDAMSYIKQHDSLDHALIHMGNETCLSTYCHDGFWSPMETIRDRDILDTMWKNGNAPWEVW